MRNEELNLNKLALSKTGVAQMTQFGLEPFRTFLQHFAKVVAQNYHPDKVGGRTSGSSPFHQLPHIKALLEMDAGQLQEEVDQFLGLLTSTGEPVAFGFMASKEEEAIEQARNTIITLLADHDEEVRKIRQAHQAELTALRNGRRSQFFDQPLEQPLNVAVVLENVRWKRPRKGLTRTINGAVLRIKPSGVAALGNLSYGNDGFVAENTHTVWAKLLPSALSQMATEDFASFLGWMPANRETKKLAETLRPPIQHGSGESLSNKLLEPRIKMVVNKTGLSRLEEVREHLVPELPIDATGAWYAVTIQDYESRETGAYVPHPRAFLCLDVQRWVFCLRATP